MKRVLVISFIFPYPMNSGGSRDIFERIKILHENGYVVDLVATPRSTPSEKDMEAMRPYVDKMWIVTRTRGVKALLSLKPFHYETRLGLRTVPFDRDYLVTIIESEFVGGILDNPTLSAKKIVLRVHNDESHLHRTLSRDATRTIDKVLFAAESWKFARYSPQVQSQSDQLWYISDAEMTKAKHSLNAAKAHHLPVAVDPVNFKHPSLDSSRILYVGALSVPINQHGLVWYLTHVHPRLLSNPDYEFVLVGKLGQANVDELMKAIKATERVTFSPDVPDLASLYASAAVFVNPIQHGAGVKIKTIDAAIEGLPIVSTTVGAEGTGFMDGVHAWIADTPERFVRGIRQALEDKSEARLRLAAAQDLLIHNNGAGNLLRLMEDVI